MDIVGENLRNRSVPEGPGRATAVHLGIAWPVYRAYAWLGFGAPAIVFQGLLVTVAGFAQMVTGEYGGVVAGAFVVYLGHILAHAGRLLAREKGTTPWGRFMDQAVARAVEIGMILVLAWAYAHGVAGVPSWFPASLTPYSLDMFLALCAAAVASILFLRYLELAHDVGLLRAHLQTTRQVPGPIAFSNRRIGVQASRDILFVAWLTGIVLDQVQLLVTLILVVHAVACLAAIGRFHTQLGRPSDEASWIMSRDYQR